MYSLFHYFFKKIPSLLICISWFSLPTYSYAVKVRNLNIKGNKIIERELISSHIKLKKGKSYSSKTVRKDVHQLFSLGFFDNIEVETTKSNRGLNVLYKVTEKLPITQVEFKGNESVQTEDLKELSLIKEYSFLNFQQIQQTIEAIKTEYKEKGYYLVEVTYKTEKSSKDKNKLKLVITIKENHKVYIKKIRFIGNRSISSSQFKSLMLTKEQNILSILGSSGVFNPAFIDRDLQFIEYYYRDKGYLSVRVEKPEITITPDKRFLYINFSISEGPRFKIGKVDFRGDDVVSSKDVKENIQLKDKEYFSLGVLQADIKFISDIYKNKGYVFAEIRPKIFPDKLEEDKVHIFLEVHRRDKYKVGRIYIRGNTYTRDKVILRRLYNTEGETYSENKKELSQQLLQQLGYFEKTDITLRRDVNQNGVLDLFVDVKERENTGEAHLAGGYNSDTKLFIQGGIKKQNFLGLDQSLALNMSFNRHQEIFTFGYQMPYFLDTNWNFAFDVFNVGQDVLGGGLNSLFSGNSQEVFSYSQLNTGFSVSLGRHLNGFSTVFLKYKLQNQSLEVDSIYFFRTLPVLSPVFKFLFGFEKPSEVLQKNSNSPLNFNDIYNLDEGKGLNSSLSAILEFDKRNDRYYASKGLFTRLSVEYSGLGGDFHYTKLQGKFSHYYPLFWKFVLKNRFNYGLVFSNVKDKTVPFTELFLLGGPYNLRGFQTNTQGPHRRSERAYKYAIENNLEYPESFAQRPYGGSQKFFYSLEIEFPVLEKAEIRAAFFFDIGEIGDTIQLDFDNQLRMDIGAGIRWKSPFGPISLDWALPYRPRKEFGEKEWEFHFSVGSGF